MKRSFQCLAIFGFMLLPAVLSAQSFDSSGNSLLQGNYFVRQVLFSNFTRLGITGRARSLSGLMVFDGAGRYSITGQIFDNAGGSGRTDALSFNGNYAVSSGGLLRMDNPLDPIETLAGGVGVSAFVGSTADGPAYDMLVGIPASRNTSNASLQGQYRLANLEIPAGDVKLARNASFLLNADGQGNLSTFTLTGHAANSGSNDEFTQTVSGGSYSLGGDQGAGTITFPGDPSSRLVAGSKTLYISSDGSVILGGSTTGFDILVGIRAFQGAASNSSYQGVYYTAGVFDDASSLSQGTNVFSTSYGSLNANGLGTTIAAERVNPTDDRPNPYNYTFDDEFSVQSDASVTESAARFFVGAGGQTVLLTGRSYSYSLQFGVQALTLPRAGSVYLNPVGVLNAASYAPITNPVTVGELVRLFGDGLSTETVTAATTPLPKTLGGVQVTVNGQLAPLYIVSPTQIVFVTPFGQVNRYAYIQVNNNGTNSNPVMVYSDNAAPGLFTIGANGIGAGIFVHADFKLVTPSNPARVGETIIAFATGLGPVDPTVPDGSIGPGNPLSKASFVNVTIDGLDAKVSFAGLAPGFVGLYQLNVQVPPNVTPGDVYFDILASGARTSQATISVTR